MHTHRNRQAYPKIHMEIQGTQNSQNSLQKTHNSHFQNFLQSTNRLIDQCSTNNSPEINPYIYSQMIFDDLVGTIFSK